MLSLVLAFAVLQQPAAPASPPATGGYSVGGAGQTYRTPSAPEAGGYRVLPAETPELARTGVTLDAYDRRVESRWGADDPFYASTVRGGAAIAQSRQGPLDGGWVLQAADGAVLYALQLVDAGEGWVEGAWRDAAGAAPGLARPAASGFIGLTSREPGQMVLRILQPGAAAPIVVTLRPSADGSWRGELACPAGESSPVVMRRR